MSFEHITIQARGLKSTIEAIGTANDAIPGQFYLAENTNEYYYGAQNGSLIGPLVAAGGQFINSIADTDSIQLVNTTGQLTAALRIDAASDNAISESATGVYSKKYIIHPDSTSFAEIDGDNRIKIKNLLFSSTTVDDTNSTIGAHLTAEGYSDLNFIYQEGDLIVLTTNSETWIHNGGTAGTAADFTKVSANVSDSYIRNLLSATDGVDYNSTTGVFSLNTTFTRGLFSGTAPISYNSGTGAFSLATNGISNSLFRQSAGVSIVGRSVNSTGNVADIAAAADGQFLVRRSNALGFGPLVAGDITAVGAVTGAANGVTKLVNNVELGGSLTKDTTIGGDFPLHLVSSYFRQNIHVHKSFSIAVDADVDNLYEVNFGNTTGNIQIEAKINKVTTGGGLDGFVQIRANVRGNTGTLYSYDVPVASGELAGKLQIKEFTTNGSGHLVLRFIITGVSIGRNVLVNFNIIDAGDANISSLKNMSISKIGTETRNSNTTVKIASNCLIGGSAFGAAAYMLDTQGDTRITTGLWVGSGTPTMASGVITAVTGYRVNNAAPSGNYLRGNGTNFVASALLASDISGTLAIANGGTGLNSLGTALQGIRVNAAGTALEYYTITPPSYTFNNGLTEAAGVVKLGGALTANTAIGLDTFNLAFTRSTGKVTFFDSTAGSSGFNVKDSDIEINSSNPGTTLHGVILKSPNGNRWRITITNEGAVNTIAL